MPGGLPEVEQRFTADGSGYTAAIAKMISDNQALISSISDAQRQIAALKGEMAGLGDKRVRVEVTGVDEAIAKVGELRSALDGLGDKTVHVGGDNGEMVRHLKDISTYMDMATDSMGRMEEHLVVIKRNTADSSADLMMQTQALRDNADAHHAAAGAVAAFSAARAAGGGRGGGGGGWGAAAAGTAAGAAAGGGGGGGGGGGFVPWRGGGAAAVRFWGMMAAEVGATVIPALTAAGAAALVGVQSVEAMVPRFKAIQTTSEALGGAFNMTTGKFLGGGSALQNAQNAFQGGGYDIAGNLLSIIQGGAGKGFISMGEQTLGMLSRGTSQMAVNFNQGGLGKKLSDALGGGPEYLRQFGDIGANLGNTLLNVAPNLPGVGGDLLSTLSGGTGALSMLTRNIPGPLIGGLLSYEAASRWGPALAGGKGLIGRMLGLKGVGGIGGMIGKAGGFLAERAPLGSALEGLGFGMSGLGGGLAAMGGPVLGALGLSAYLGSKLYSSMPSSAERRMGALQAGIGAAGFSGAWQPLAKAVTTATGLQGLSPAEIAASARGVGAAETPGAMMRFGPMGQTAVDIYRNAATGFAQQMGDLVNSGPQLQSALKKAGLKGVGMADAFQIAQNALLDVTHAFGKDGKLTQAAQQQVTAYAKVIAPMTQSPGAFGAAVGAQTIMSQGAMQQLSKVNAAMDSYQAIIAGGPTGASALAAGAGAAPAGAIAKGLTGYGTPASAAAWQAFASTSSTHPGFITQMQSFGDQMRTYLTLGTATLGQTKGFSASELQRILPQAKQSPAALAMLMQQGAAAGVTGYYDPSKSQAQNYKDVAASLHSAAYSSAQFKQNMDVVTRKTANIPAVAAQFADATAATVQSQRMAKVAQDAIAIKGGVKVQIHAADIVSQLRAAGVQGGAALKASLDAILAQAGVGKAQRVKIEGQYFPPHIPKPPNQSFTINGHVNMPPIPRVPNQSFTITGHVVMVGGQVSPYTPAGARANLGPAAYFHPAAAGVSPSAYTHLQTGGLVPGSGRGDIIPSMLEPGEAIVPRNLVPLVAPILALHNVPGFGGTPKGASTHFAAGGIVPHMLGFPDPTRASGNVGQHIGFTLVDGITKALNQAGASKIAQALVSKVAQELQYAKSVSSQTQQGLNLGGMDTTQGSVIDQMSSYLGSVKSFTGDVRTLRKQHLNKNIMQQLIAAGPVQGDALAQSILQGGGTSGKSGAAQVNQLWAQIGKASNALGAQAAMSKYGGYLSGDLKHATASQSHVTININAGSGSGGLNLSPADIKKIVAEVQAKLLQQAHRNRKTGVKLQGKNA